MSKNEVFEKKLQFLFLSFLCWRQRNRTKKNNKMEKGPKPYNNSVFKGGHSKIREMKKMDFFFAKKSWHYLCQEGRKTRIFVHTICFGQNMFWTKTVKTSKNKKKSGFSGNCPKPRMTPFFWKRCFLRWANNWVLLTMFLKSCVILKTLYL